MDVEKVEVGGEVYEVREIPMSQMWPILEGDPSKISKSLLRASVFKNGNLVGDSLDSTVGFKTYRKLTDAANRVNGLAEESEEESEEGKL